MAVLLVLGKLLVADECVVLDELVVADEPVVLDELVAADKPVVSDEQVVADELVVSDEQIMLRKVDELLVEVLTELETGDKLTVGHCGRSAFATVS